MIERPSPNFDDRAPGSYVKHVILHYTGMVSAEAALDRLCDANAKVSAHYMIDEGGEIFQLVQEDKRAWHAGVSSWQGMTDINSYSIGIELVNPGHDYPGYQGDYRAFPEAQMASLKGLLGDIISRHDVKLRFILGHSDVAPGRKIDPGELFDWPGLAKEGLAIWPEVKPDTTGDYLQALSDFGYDVDVSGGDTEKNRQVISAFQRHFRPDNFDGIADQETMNIALALMKTIISKDTNQQ